MGQNRAHLTRETLSKRSISNGARREPRFDKENLVKWAQGLAHLTRSPLSNRFAAWTGPLLLSNNDYPKKESE